MTAKPTRPTDEEPTDTAAPPVASLSQRIDTAMEHIHKTIGTRPPQTPPQAVPLPLVDEEELSAIADPATRERERRKKMDIYKQFPHAREIAEAKSASLKAEKAKLLHLPVFPQETRPTVNVIANSALFAAIQGKDRLDMKKCLLDTQDGIEIIFTGEQFNQDDHDVLMQLVYLASHYELGQPVTVSAHALLKALGRGTSGKEHKQLKAEIDRLVTGTIQLRTKRFDYIGHLIDDAQQDKETKFWTYRANPTLRKFYDVENYTLIDWEERKALKGKDLARWLQLQLASHARPFPMKVATIRRLSGSRAKELRTFRQKLKLALEDLKTHGFIMDWQIDKSDLVHIDRGDAVSASQQRHLAKPAARRCFPKPQR